MRVRCCSLTVLCLGLCAVSAQAVESGFKQSLAEPSLASTYALDQKLFRPAFDTRLGRLWHTQRALWSGVGLAGFVGFSYVATLELQPSSLPCPGCDAEFASEGGAAPRTRAWARTRGVMPESSGTTSRNNAAVGVGFAVLSGALWLTLSETNSPIGARTRFGVRPVEGGSVALVGAAF